MQCLIGPFPAPTFGGHFIGLKGLLPNAVIPLVRMTSMQDSEINPPTKLRGFVHVMKGEQNILNRYESNNTQRNTHVQLKPR